MTKINMNGTAAVVVLVLGLGFGVARMSAESGYDLFQKALAAERADGNIAEAIKLYERITKDFASDHALMAKTLLRLGDCYQKLGDDKAQAAFERVVREFGDQKEAAAEARTRLAALQAPAASQTKRAARQVWTDAKVCCGTRPDTTSPDGRSATWAASSPRRPTRLRRSARPSC